MEKALLEVGKSFSFYIISKQIEVYSSTFFGHFTGHMMKAEQFFFKKVTLGDLQAQQQKLGCLIFPKTFNTSIVEQ